METNEFIPLDVFSRHCNVTVSFFEMMAEGGWIEIARVEERYFIAESQLAEAEKLARLHSELQINPEGVEVVMTLLERMKKMQAEISLLKEELDHYKSVH